MSVTHCMGSFVISRAICVIYHPFCIGVKGNVTDFNRGSKILCHGLAWRQGPWGFQIAASVSKGTPTCCTARGVPMMCDARTLPMRDSTLPTIVQYDTWGVWGGMAAVMPSGRVRGIVLCVSTCGWCQCRTYGWQSVECGSVCGVPEAAGEDQANSVYFDTGHRTPPPRLCHTALSRVKHNRAHKC